MAPARALSRRRAIGERMWVGGHIDMFYAGVAAPPKPAIEQRPA